jgi:hypothetical protein
MFVTASESENCVRKLGAHITMVPNAPHVFMISNPRHLTDVILEAACALVPGTERTKT